MYVLGKQQQVRGGEEPCREQAASKLMPHLAPQHHQCPRNLTCSVMLKHQHQCTPMSQSCRQSHLLNHAAPHIFENHPTSCVIYSLGKGSQHSMCLAYKFQACYSNNPNNQAQTAPSPISHP